MEIVFRCPYCPKKFIATVYLLSHMQRRHQGLPIQPMLSQTQSAHNVFVKQLPQQSLASSSVVNVGPQEFECVLIPDKDKPKMKQMTTTRANDKNIDAKLGVRTPLGQAQGFQPQIWPGTLPLPAALVEKADEHFQKQENELEVLRHKVENDLASFEAKFEAHEKFWRLKVSQDYQSGIQELKSAFDVLLTQMQKMQEIMTLTTSASNTRRAEQVEARESQTQTGSPPEEMTDKHEVFIKQKNELGNLLQTLKDKTETDLVSIDAKLAAQERFWRSKMSQVEEEYSQQFSKLREDLKVSNFASSVALNIQEKPITESETIIKENPTNTVTPSDISATRIYEQEDEPSTPTSVKTVSQHSHSPEQVVSHKPPRPPKINPAISPDEHVEVQKKVPAVLAPVPVPVPRPRTAHITTGRTAIESIPASALHHEYEEPNDFQQQDQVSDYSSSEVSSSSEEEKRKKRKFAQGLKKPLGGGGDSKERMKMAHMDEIRKKVIADLNSHMKGLGLNSDGSPEVDGEQNKAKAVLSRLRHQRRRREKTDKKFRKERLAVKEKVSFAAAAEVMKPNLEHITVGKPQKSTSPLIKMLSAVKTRGTSWKNKVATSFSKRSPKAAKKPKEPRLKTFFTRIRKKKPKAKSEVVSDTDEDSDTSSIHESSSTTSEEKHMPMLTRSKPILFEEGKKEREKKNAKAAALSEVSETSEPESHPVEVLKPRRARVQPPPKKKPVERNLLMDFEAVASKEEVRQVAWADAEPQIVPRIREVNEISGQTQSSSSIASGTENSRSSDTDNDSIPQRNDKSGGHYVTLRTPTVVQHQKGEAPMPRTSTPNAKRPTNSGNNSWDSDV